MFDCTEYHDGDEETCIECSNKTYGGNWKRIICLIIGHAWYDTYSWIGQCERCEMWREWV